MVDLVVALNGNAFAESQDVCINFNKAHRETLRKIDDTIRELTVQNRTVKDYFIESSYTTSRNRKYRNFLMTRDGFTLLGMSFTGDKAMEFKLKYMEAFNQMEASLRQQSFARMIGKETRKKLTDHIQESGENERMHGYGYSNYTKMAYKAIGIKYVKPKKGQPDVRDTLSSEELSRLKNVEDLIKGAIEAGKQYDAVKEMIGMIFGLNNVPTQKKLEAK